MESTLSLLALCEPCFYFVFEGYAMIYTTASQAGMVVAALPLAVVVAAWLLLGERPHRRVWIGFVLAVVGVVWLSAGSEATEARAEPRFSATFLKYWPCCAALFM